MHGEEPGVRGQSEEPGVRRRGTQGPRAIKTDLRCGGPVRSEEPENPGNFPGQVTGLFAQNK